MDILLSRDLDSYLTARESSAVKEWLTSPYPFHVMRDNFWHQRPIMGGMWGVKLQGNGEVRALLQKVWANATENGSKHMLAKRESKGPDQDLLEM